MDSQDLQDQKDLVASLAWMDRKELMGCQEYPDPAVWWACLASRVKEDCLALLAPRD